MASRIISKTDLRDRIRAELADLGDDTIVVTERGRPVAVVVNVERWNELQLMLEELEDRTAVLEHRAGAGGGVPAEQLFASIEADDADVPGQRPAAS
ncbi:MAG: type II toxin-antitoxin system prevent-host-death family antitoxin [Pseudonocardiales bacterium]|nr:type II toxin-antitoxin system prevent-host-death family antitoxin [Pseudonocardiales bacterium]